MIPADAYDVLGLGCTAVDDLFYVAGYPPPDTKVQIGRREKQCGGLTATALIAAAPGRSEWPGSSDLLALVDHLIVNRDFAAKLTGATDPAAAVARLWTGDRKVVIVTCGAEGCWCLSDSDRMPRHYPAFAVQAV